MRDNHKLNSSPSHDSDPKSLVERLRVAAELLEEIGADRSLIADVPEEDRNRFLNAAGVVSRPDAISRRQLLKVVKRQLRAKRVLREETLLAATGIRTLRRQPVFITSPNIFAPKADALLGNAPHMGETEDLRVCYVCKVEFSAVHHFYDRM